MKMLLPNASDVMRGLGEELPELEDTDAVLEREVL